MRFVYPWMLMLLFLLPLVGLLGAWMLRVGGRRMAAFVSPAMRARLAPSPRPGWVAAQLVLMLAGLALLALAAARPQWGRAELRVAARGRNLLIALDVSRSMLAADVHPNRLERAKADILDLLDELQGDRAGLLVFRGKANMLCPLTTDRAFLRQALDGASIDAAPRGETDLADAINRSLEALESATDQNNAILLITDGEDLAGRAVAAAQQAARRGIPIFTVGIGDPQGASVPAVEGSGSLQYQGRAVVSRLDETTLGAIARTTGGTYIPLATSSTASTTLGAIYRQHLTRVAAREYEEQLERRYIERYQLFLIPSILLLLATAALSRGRLAGGRRARAPRADGDAEPATGTTADDADPTTSSSAGQPPLPPPIPGHAVLVGLLLLGVGATLPARADDVVSTNAVAESSPAALASTNGPEIPPGRAGARIAQKLYRQGRFAEAAEAYLAAARGADPAEANRYRYNAALAQMRAGQAQTAAATARPLSMLAGQGAAAELYGAASFQVAAGEAAATNARLRAAQLEQAGAGFQQALRVAPGEGRLHRNLDRALAPLPEAREAAHIEAVLEAHGQTPPDALLGAMLQAQRDLVRGATASFTNRQADVLIRQLEAHGEAQRKNADLWIPLKRALVESEAITNAQQRALVAEQIEQARDTMQRGARRLADLEGEALGELAQAEQSVYLFWQLLSMPPALVAEAIAAQTNAWAHPETPRLPHRPDQPHAARLTQLFQEKFGPWADQIEQQAQADTNAPSFAPGARAEIEQLTAATLQLHQQILEAMQSGGPRPVEAQHEALRNLVRIQELLPKNKNQSQQQPQQNQQQQQQQDQ